MNCARLALFGAAAALLVCGCSPLREYEGQIESGTQALQRAKTDAERAKAYGDRGRGYSEKARYLRAFKRISADEYARLFDQAVADQDRAIALAPDSGRLYVGRGRTYFDRAALEEQSGPEARKFYGSARADFTAAIEKEARNPSAFDWRGLLAMSTGDHDAAIADFAREAELDPKTKYRLADAYCERGRARLRAKSTEAAIGDFRSSIEAGTAADACECQPYDPLLALYTDQRRFDDGWALVRTARASGKSIAPELVEALKKGSGRDH